MPQTTIHIENSSAIGPLFRITPETLAHAAARRPGLLERCTLRFGEDLDGFERSVSDADVLLGWHFPHADLARLAPRLRWVHLTGAGVDHLLPLDWLPGGVTLTNARGAHAPKIGEALMLGVLMLNNAVPTLMDRQREHRWDQRFTTGIAGKTLLVVGVGEAGGSAAEHAKRFGLRVVGIRRSATPHGCVDEMRPMDALDDALAEADFVVVTVPALPATRGMIDARRLSLLRPTAGLVSLGRHGVVDEAALVAALRAGTLAGAVVDVEDPSTVDLPEGLWDCPNLLVLPHSQTNDPERFMANVLDGFLANLARHLDGEPLRNVVRPDLGY